MNGPRNQHRAGIIFSLLTGLIVGVALILTLPAWFGLAFMFLMFGMAFLWATRPGLATAIGVGGVAYAGYKAYQHYEHEHDEQ